MKMDVALKITNGVLMGLQDKGQVLCVQDYSNIVCIILL